MEQVPGPQISRTSGTTTHFQQTSTTSHISGTETRIDAVGQATPRSGAQTMVSSYGQQVTRNTTLEVKRRQTTLKWAQPSSNNENNLRMPTGTLGQLSITSLNNRQSVAERTMMPEPSVAHPASVAGIFYPFPCTFVALCYMHLGLVRNWCNIKTYVTIANNVIVMFVAEKT